MPAAVVFILFVICLIIAIPVSIALTIASVLPGAFDPSFTASGQFVIRSMLGGIDSFPLLAVPMFVLSGIIMARGGISKKLFDVFSYFLGNLTAGLPCAVIVTCLFYGAISGSGPATVAAVGSMTIPILISKWGIMSIDLQNAIDKDMAVIHEDGKTDYVDAVKAEDDGVVSDQELQEVQEDQPAAPGTQQPDPKGIEASFFG